MWRLFGLVSSICLCVIPALPLATEDVQDPGHYLNSFLIRVEKREIAEQVAAEHGFQVLDEISPLKMFLLYHPSVTRRSKRSAGDYVARLQEDPRVHFAEQQITLKRVKRNAKILHDKQLELPIRDIRNLSLFYRAPAEKIATRGHSDLEYNDPLYDDQWYLGNRGQTGGKRDIDVNVRSAWDNGFTGQGVVISILDDGIDHDHEDIKKNYDPRASADLNDEDDTENDPVPDKTRSGNSHGTRCAGEVAAAAGNGVCGVGIAYDSKIGGIRILDGKVTDHLEAKALLYNMDHIDIMSASWGPHDDGCTMEGPKKACSDALKKGAEEGRGKKGTIFVWATGNGGGYNDTCAADGYVSSPYSVSIGSLSDEGKLPFYMEKCSSTMGVIPTGGQTTRAEELRNGKYKINVVTTDLDGGCTENFEGTSSAAPLGAGCIALVLQANPKLNWRDVQHIIAHGSRIPIIDDSWTINGAGFHVNYKYGFGMLDCSKMVELAQSWKNRPDQHTCTSPLKTEGKDIPSSGCTKIQFQFSGCQDDSSNSITDLEHVELSIKIKTGYRGNTEIFLTSPSGTRSVMLQRRDRDDSEDGINFTFMTVHNWGEDPAGQWTLEVCDNPGTETPLKPNKGVLESWSLRAYGFHNPNPSSKKRAYTPTEKKLKATMKVELDSAKRVVIKRAQNPVMAVDKKGGTIDKKKVQSEVREYYGFLRDIAKMFTRRELEELGMDSRDLAALYGHDSRSRLNADNEAKSEEDYGYDYKRGYNTQAFEDVLNLGDDDNEDTAVNRENDIDLEEIKREILDIMKDLDQGDSGYTRQNSYIDEYYKRKKKIEHEKRINTLLNQLEEYLETKK